jgi:hypothetical protein
MWPGCFLERRIERCVKGQFGVTRRELWHCAPGLGDPWQRAGGSGCEVLRTAQPFSSSRPPGFHTPVVGDFLLSCIGVQTAMRTSSPPVSEALPFDLVCFFSRVLLSSTAAAL